MHLTRLNTMAPEPKLLIVSPELRHKLRLDGVEMDELMRLAGCVELERPGQATIKIGLIRGLAATGKRLDQDMAKELMRQRQRRR